jgi:hypothetical protein
LPAPVTDNGVAVCSLDILDPIEFDPSMDTR